MRGGCETPILGGSEHYGANHSGYYVGNQLSYDKMHGVKYSPCVRRQNTQMSVTLNELISLADPGFRERGATVFRGF